MTGKHRDILWHSLGMTRKNYRRSLAWWLDNDNHRNNFAAEPASGDMALILDLVSLRYMRRGRDIPGGLIYFHVTDDGIRAARDNFPGPSKAAPRRRSDGR